ncbi:hypothetical protein [Halobaculum limi]|uniref:hypothetical protein n=1 Tax=Halobaculum limi TaxID=3031916 RepID=UPI00240654EB|nr:hypothetical protein [Halobaculum sp. YSMS11]
MSQKDAAAKAGYGTSWATNRKQEWQRGERNNLEGVPNHPKKKLYEGVASLPLLSLSSPAETYLLATCESYGGCKWKTRSVGSGI